MKKEKIISDVLKHKGTKGIVFTALRYKETDKVGFYMGRRRDDGRLENWIGFDGMTPKIDVLPEFGMASPFLICDKEAAKVVLLGLKEFGILTNILIHYLLIKKEV